ncbi:hypothetical protein [Microbacterium sp. P05]|uniref:hypothetical protein n=1 Tax=Microbacterium sp. P05 TaxID=3366948 RepID=UPI0037476B19
MTIALVGAGTIVVLGAIVIGLVWAFGRGSVETAPTPAPSASSEPSAPPATGPTASTVDCTGEAVTVRTSAELQSALDEAAAGSLIMLASGTYPGNFDLTASGTEQAPIRLCGPVDAVLDGGRVDDGYVLHLDGVSYWQLAGFSIRNGQKGLMADATTNTLVEALTITEIGDEAVHFRADSTDNVIAGNVISDTGKRRAKFGEGIYIGSAESNWCDITACDPDRSDRNVIRDNTISATTAESIDVKEGTTGGIVENNSFDGSALEEDDADSWVDIKGNEWIIRGNVGVNSPVDGFQTHEILDGWGARNVFSSNTADVNGSGFGYAVTDDLDNVVECSNSASGAGEGVSNIDCSAGSS